MAKGSAKARLTMARLVVVQMLYRQTYDESTAMDVLTDLRDNGFMQEEGIEWVDPDLDHLANTLRGVDAHKDVITEALKANLKSEQLNDRLLSSIIKAGAYELIYTQDVDTALVIAEYLTITSAFFEGKETTLVNAVLDKIAKSARG